MSVAIGEYLSTAETAEAIGVSPGRVRQFAIQGRLAAKKIGTVLFFKTQDVKDFAKSKRLPGRPKMKKNRRRS
jgi:excisionase family DNA binding protein